MKNKKIELKKEIILKLNFLELNYIQNSIINRVRYLEDKINNHYIEDILILIMSVKELNSLLEIKKMFGFTFSLREETEPNLKRYTEKFSNKIKE